MIIPPSLFVIWVAKVFNVPSVIISPELVIELGGSSSVAGAINSTFFNVKVPCLLKIAEPLFLSKITFSKVAVPPLSMYTTEEPLPVIKPAFLINTLETINSPAGSVTSNNE